ncbi:MAG TPA: EthD family reductase [Candidatus Dormibacteraeota bacterium]|nr:EthD family reductase [Candidatus Dormibacteraeota bacterium]
MIKVSVLYPSQEGSTFDMAYYCNTHIPMVRRLLAPAVKGVAVEQGIGGMAPGSPAPYTAMGHLLFESLEAFQTAFAPHAQAILSDIPNYTRAQPVIQISEVKL